MRLSITVFALAAGLGTAAAAQDQDPVQLAQEEGVCGEASVATAERLPDGRIAVQCNTGPVTLDPEVSTQTTGAGAGTGGAAGTGAAAGAAAGAAGPATGFVPLIAPAAAVAGVAAVVAFSSSSGTQSQ